MTNSTNNKQNTAGSENLDNHQLLNCKLCSGTNTNTFILGDTELIQCPDCGIVYNSSFRSIEELEKYYKEDYKITTDDIVETEKRRIFRLPEQIELIYIISGFKPAPASILDFGCDKAFFLDEARRYGYNTTGIEQSVKAKEYSNIIGINSYPALNDLNEKYDVVVMWHSLEHIPEPKQILKQLSDKMNPDSYIFIRVPAFDSLFRKIFGKRWIWFQPENHYFHYSLESLAYLLKEAGFKVESITHRKPNNLLTRQMNIFSNRMFKRYFEHKLSLKKRLSRIYQDITAVEIFAVARKK